MHRNDALSPARSWIPPEFVWEEHPELVALEVSVNDTGVVPLIAKGVMEIRLWGQIRAAKAVAKAWGCESLEGQAANAAIVTEALVRSHADDGSQLWVANYYCHAAFMLPDERHLCVLVSTEPACSGNRWLSAEIKARAVQLLAEHEQEVAAHEIKRARDQEDAEKLAGDDPEARKLFEFADWLGAPKRPVLTSTGIADQVPRAVMFARSRSSAPGGLLKLAADAVASSGLALSRDGTYAGILATDARGKGAAVVPWVPFSGPPSYPEVRWAIQKGLPKALRKPRLEEISRPNFEPTLSPLGDTIVDVQLDPEGPEVFDALNNLQLDDTDFRDRVARVRADLKDLGFEAIAWYQSYHVWNESTWGIYFDARKLDDLALSFFDDFRRARVNGSQTDAAVLAFGLTYAHEFFHARVEAALSWMEVNALQPRHLRYKERVYDVLRETPDWLEEALANWSGWQWYQSEPVRSAFSGSVRAMDGLDRIVEESLDLSPPGYCEWRIGHDPARWRRFGTQLATGKPASSKKAGGLPLESVLRNPLPYDLQSFDIPLHFVGRGVIADRLQTHPAIFNVPSRRELEKALKFFKHVLDPGGGKGSHQKWVGPDQRAFILPERDPVSVRVFRTFLQYLGIDKMTYAREVRPQL